MFEVTLEEVKEYLLKKNVNYYWLLIKLDDDGKVKIFSVDMKVDEEDIL